MNRRKIVLLILTVGIWMLISGNRMIVHAETASVTFGSTRYQKNTEQRFPVGMYLKAEGEIGEYHIVLHYDTAYLRYVSGADRADTQAGDLFFDGESRENGSRYWLNFQALKEGTTHLTVTSVQMYSPYIEIQEEITVSGNETETVTRTERTEYAINAMANAPVMITTPPPEPEPEPEPQPEPEPEPQPEPESGTRPDDGAESQTSPPEVEPEPEHGSEQQTTLPSEAETGQESESIVIMNPSDGEPEDEKPKNTIWFHPVVLLFVAVFLLVLIIELVIYFILKKRREKKGDPNAEAGKDSLADEIIDLEDYENSSDYYDINNDAQYMAWKQDMQDKFGDPVIQVKDVTMEFHLSSYNPSGLKDYLIQLLKRQVVYRKLFALYHVSMHVFRGEVVGIIGTNGSGKSTLLKLISGALKPTEGKVIVDQRKVQLLTLGTGFDMELTARENVYLNGSIIGYSKEFLDEHYQDIVEFAQLQDFMEEKVKNFSSGMVSRLGFAIATAGKAAEILILDEVLAVGDEFFRKKSLAKVKEMIHGGSTVLLVSHGMGTILENCTRCVWIEKGKLKMVGEPKKVCEAYQKYGGKMT